MNLLPKLSESTVMAVVVARFAPVYRHKNTIEQIRISVWLGTREIIKPAKLGFLRIRSNIELRSGT